MKCLTMLAASIGLLLPEAAWAAGFAAPGARGEDPARRRGGPYRPLRLRRRPAAPVRGRARQRQRGHRRPEGAQGRFAGSPGSASRRALAIMPATTTLYVANAGDGSVRLFQGPPIHASRPHRAWWRRRQHPGQFVAQQDRRRLRQGSACGDRSGKPEESRRYAAQRPSGELPVRRGGFPHIRERTGCPAKLPCSMSAPTGRFRRWRRPERARTSQWPSTLMSIGCSLSFAARPN